MESQRLSYIATHQTDIRAEQYDQLLSWAEEGDAGPVGKRTILPATFGGGPRDMNGRYMDAMALVRHFGKPDYFITMTCNPKWPVRFAEA